MTRVSERTKEWVERQINNDTVVHQQPTTNSQQPTTNMSDQQPADHDTCSHANAKQQQPTCIWSQWRFLIAVLLRSAMRGMVRRNWSTLLRLASSISQFFSYNHNETRVTQLLHVTQVYSDMNITIIQKTMNSVDTRPHIDHTTYWLNQWILNTLISRLF